MQSAKRNTQTAVTATISGSAGPFEAETTTGVGRVVEDVVADDDVSEAERDCTNVSVAVTTVPDCEETEMEVIVIMPEDEAGVVEAA